GLCDRGVGAAGELPVGAGFDAFEEVVGDAHRVVRVLPGDGDVGFRFPIRVVNLEIDFRDALAGKLDDPLDIVLRDHRPPGEADFALQGGVGGRVEFSVFMAGRHDPV